MLQNSSLQDTLVSELVVADDLRTNSEAWLARDITPLTDSSYYGDPDANWALQPFEPPLRQPTTERTDTPLRSLSTLNFDYSVRRLVIHPDGETMATVGSLTSSSTIEQTNTIQIWHWRTGQRLFTLSGHTAPILTIALSADGQYLVSGSRDRTVKVWNFLTGQEVITLHDHLSPVTAVAISADGQTVISAGCNQYASFEGNTRIMVRDRVLRIWDVKRGKPLHLVPCVTDVPEIIIGTGDLFMKVEQQPEVLSLQTGEKISTLVWNSNLERFHAIAPNWNTVVTAMDQQVTIHDFKTGKVKSRIQFDRADANGVAQSTHRSQAFAISPNGQRFVSGFRRTSLHPKHNSYQTTQNVLRIWNAETGEHLGWLDESDVGQGLWQSVQFSVDSQLLVTSVGQTVRIWQNR